MKLLKIFLFVFIFSSLSYSQTPILTIDKMEVSFMNIQDGSELFFPKPTDTAKIKMVMVFNITNRESVKKLDFKIGKQQGTSDYKKTSYTIIKENNISYLLKGKKKFPIENNRVMVDEDIQYEAMQGQINLDITGSDTKNKELKYFSKKIK